MRARWLLLVIFVVAQIPPSLAQGAATGLFRSHQCDVQNQGGLSKVRNPGTTNVPPIDEEFNEISDSKDCLVVHSFQGLPRYQSISFLAQSVIPDLASRIGFNEASPRGPPRS